MMRQRMMRWSVGIVRAAAVREDAASVEGKGGRMAQVFVLFVIDVVVVVGMIERILSG